MVVDNSKKTVSCDGTSEDAVGNISINSKHPLVYFKVTKDNNAECPYCGKIFSYCNKE